ncbi:hypothetical protein M1N51_00625 [Peptococcaceae bacterium]|nr:hypothetical protein [Peptococcaceae bacterium]MCL0071712.1 hypothetical protein [Peptococcaceae bacterium]
MEKVAYILLAIVALFWLAGMFLGMIAAFPIGVVGIIGTMGIGLLLIKVIGERISNEEDDYYSRNC